MCVVCVAACWPELMNMVKSQGGWLSYSTICKHSLCQLCVSSVCPPFPPSNNNNNRSDVEVLRPGPLVTLARPITPDMLQVCVFY